VNDVTQSIEFYTEALGFKLVEQYGPAMAILSYGDFTLWVAGPMSSAAKPMPSGDRPAPGGWNRFMLPVKDLTTLVSTMKAKGLRFRNEITQGPGGSQILCEDPSGNVVELFQSD